MTGSGALVGTILYIPGRVYDGMLNGVTPFSS